MLPGRIPNQFRIPFRLISLAGIALLLAACNLPRATPVIPTLTPISTNTFTPVVNTPTVTPPVSLPIPTNTITASTTNIVFAAGTTAAVETGTIQPGQIQAFTLSAGQSQPMILLLNSTNSDATLAVYEASGNVLLDPAKKWSSWQWLLPKTEVYTIDVIGGSTSGNFTLTAKVAARIAFASGSTSATVTGSTNKGYVITYTVSALANQSLTVALDVPANTAVLDIFGLADGNALLGASAKAISFTGTLSSTQDYIIEIFPTNGQVVNYSLTVSVH